jgi:hypothetical protein
MLGKIIEIKDLFYCLIQHLSYSDWINISFLDKKSHQKIKCYRKIKNISNLLNEKFNQYSPKILNLSFLDPYLFLWNTFKVYPIKKYQRDLFIEKSVHVSDIIQYHSQLFFIDEALIYSSYFIENSSFVPKIIIRKYGIKRYENIPYLNAFVSVQFNDFDWTKIKTFDVESIIYVKIWNDSLQSDIIIYLFHDGFSKEEKTNEWIIKHSKNKLEQIITYHRFHLYPFEFDSYFMDRGDIQIFTTSKFTKDRNQLTGWFLE